ncbi:DUF1524 domain-containing protein [Streptomyces sp. NPDC058221]|uniref:GmrSD restriction endonuclease domain-containing protein n=1 Tax=Streptomyces sp. NPDC058221 TaxID=3346388 RepID=UPI0036E34BCE
MGAGSNFELRSRSDRVAVAMTSRTPYTGTATECRKRQAAEVQIDHVMPLSYDWQMDAARWNEAKRQQIANDPIGLVPMGGPSGVSGARGAPSLALG